MRGKIPQAFLDPGGKIFAAIAFHRLRRKFSAGLGRNHDVLSPIALKLCDQTFAAAHAVYVRRIDKIHAAVGSLMEGCKRFLIVHGAPGASNSPCAETYLRDAEPGSTKVAIVHTTLS